MSSRREALESGWDEACTAAQRPQLTAVAADLKLEC